MDFSFSLYSLSSYKYYHDVFIVSIINHHWNSNPNPKQHPPTQKQSNNNKKKKNGDPLSFSQPGISIPKNLLNPFIYQYEPERIQ